jgi:hypothetical protein
MQGFLLKLLVSAVQNEQIRRFLFEVVDRLATLLLPKLAAVIPVAVGAGIKGLGDILPDIDIPDLPDVVETVRRGVNNQLPDGIDIPIVSDAFEQFTGLDLSDLLLGRDR